MLKYVSDPAYRLFVPPACPVTKLLSSAVRVVLSIVIAINVDGMFLLEYRK